MARAVTCGLLAMLRLFCASVHLCTSLLALCCFATRLLQANCANTVLSTQSGVHTPEKPADPSSSLMPCVPCVPRFQTSHFVGISKCTRERLVSYLDMSPCSLTYLTYPFCRNDLWTGHCTATLRPLTRPYLSTADGPFKMSRHVDQSFEHVGSYTVKLITVHRKILLGPRSYLERYPLPKSLPLRSVAACRIKTPSSVHLKRP